MKNRLTIAAALFCGSAALGQTTFVFTGTDGLSAEATFTQVGASTLTLSLTNTSTGVPMGFGASDQLLTGISWDAGGLGNNIGDIQIIGGSAAIGAGSMSMNFDNSPQLFGGADVSVEFGFSNSNGSGLLQNFISANVASATPFQAIDALNPNLDGPNSLNGPQPGLVSATQPVALGGQGAILDTVVFTLNFDQTINSFDDLFSNGIRVEFGSDASFVTIPAPASIGLIGLGTLAAARRR